MLDELLSSNILLIAATEVAVVLIALCFILFLQNRSQKNVIKRLKERLGKLIEDLRNAGQSPPQEETATNAPSVSYAEQINTQIDITRDHHESLNPPQDIILDLAPESPIPRRAAALRYAVLLAEKDAVSANEATPDWSKLRQKYEQIFSFYEDFADETDGNQGSGGSSEEIDLLNEELTNAKKRINNLEKFKALYFDLEEKWKEAKDNADTHYQGLSEMVSQVEDSAQFEQKLTAYHSSYNSVNSIIEGGVDGTTILTETIKVGDSDATGELRHLRAVTADQHQIINKLEQRLRDSSSDEERVEIVASLQEELQKQSRFIQESETCIQLMEDELQNSHRENEQLKSRLHALPQLKTELKETRELKDEYELKMYAMKTENSKLTKRLKEAQNSGPAVDHSDVKGLKKQINDMETQYAELEEKYLDLKLLHT